MHVSDKGSSVTNVLLVVGFISTYSITTMVCDFNTRPWRAQPSHFGIKLSTAGIWVWKQKMCSATRDLSLQMYALSQITFVLLVGFESLPPPTIQSYPDYPVDHLLGNAPTIWSSPEANPHTFRSSSTASPSGVHIFPITIFLFKGRCFSRFSFTALINTFYEYTRGVWRHQKGNQNPLI